MLPRTAQMVIIGGGVLGTSAALHLAAAGHTDIVLLDRGPIAGGTTLFAAWCSPSIIWLGWKRWKQTKSIISSWPTR
jgi:glycine/D-amino acid oxidase-like deaminating enzyme